MPLLSSIAGVILVAIALIDIFFMVLHVDSSGVVSPRLHRAIWNILVAASLRFGRLRRRALALAGPIMLAATFVFWVSLFIVGFALIYMPYLPGFRAEAELLPLTFIDALYYSGVTGTVLGYGDLTPTQAVPKVLSFVQSGIGFALLTVVISYLINVLTSVAERDSLAVKLHQKTGQSGKGRQYIIRYLQQEDVSMLPNRLDRLTDTLHMLQERMHHFPFIDIYYRSLDPSHDPEPMLERLLEVAIAARLVAGSKAGAVLIPAAQDISQAVSHLMEIFMYSHFDTEARSQMKDTAPGDADRRYLHDINQAISDALGRQYAHADSDNAELLDFAYRARVFTHNINKLSKRQSAGA
jgi:uncharacterized membrane protein